MTLYPASLRQALSALAGLWPRKGCRICGAHTHNEGYHTQHEIAQHAEMRGSR